MLSEPETEKSWATLTSLICDGGVAGGVGGFAGGAKGGELGRGGGDGGGGEGGGEGGAGGGEGGGGCASCSICNPGFSSTPPVVVMAVDPRLAHTKRRSDVSLLDFASASARP